MREALAKAAKNKPVVPVVSNVAVQPLSDPDEIVRRLVEQVTGRVRWRETVEWFGANGVTTLYEVGAGKVLSGLARRINRDICHRLDRHAGGCRGGAGCARLIKLELRIPRAYMNTCIHEARHAHFCPTFRRYREAP